MRWSVAARHKLTNTMRKRSCLSFSTLTAPRCLQDDAAAYLMENKFEGMMCLILSHTRGADTNAVLS